MNKTDLVAGYSLFGNKGDVFNKTAHICKDGFDPNTLCGKPMLSSNWVQINGVNEIGCPECIAEYRKINKLNGYVASYKGKQMDVYADSSLNAQQQAAVSFKAKKSYEVSVYLCERCDGSQLAITNIKLMDMNENTLSHDTMVALQKVLIEQMVQNTKNYFSDFVSDMYEMNSLNEKGELTGKYIFMSRTNGTEFGRADDERLTHDWGFTNKKYEIDFEKLRQINMKELDHYSNLLKREGTNHLSDFWVIEEIE